MTNKKELQEQAKRLQEELDKLNEQIDNIDNDSCTRWRAEKFQETYWTVDIRGKCVECWDYYNAVDNFAYNTGNYFKTEEEAEDYRNNLITKQKLKDLALILNKGKRINFDNSDRKYSIYLADENVSQTASLSIMDIGQVYCLDENFIDIAKKEIGEDNIINLIKSGV